MLWNEILYSEPTLLEGGSRPDSSANHLTHVEITLNAPRINAFNKLLSEGQKSYYRRRYYILISMMKSYIYDSSFIFEYCRDGTVHLHACWLVQLPWQITPAGFVSNTVKCWLNTLTKKYNKFNASNIYFFDNDTTICYKCPSIKCKLCLDQELRFYEWFEYMCKTI